MGEVDLVKRMGANLAVLDTGEDQYPVIRDLTIPLMREAREEIERLRDALLARKAWDIAEDEPLDEWTMQHRTALCALSEHLTAVALDGKTEPFTPQPHGIDVRTCEIVASDEAECRHFMELALALRANDPSGEGA